MERCEGREVHVAGMGRVCANGEGEEGGEAGCEGGWVLFLGVGGGEKEAGS